MVRNLSCLTVVLAAITAGSSALAAQASLRAAEETTAILPRQTGFISIDLRESALGVRFYQEASAGKEPGTHDVCGTRFSWIADHVEHAGELSFAAEKGRRTLLGKHGLTPGIDASYTFSRYFEHGFIPPAVCPPPGKQINASTRGYEALFLRLGVGTVDRGTVTGVGSTADVVAVNDEIGTNAELSLGWNHAIREDRIFGALVSVGHEWSSPGGTDPFSYCTLAGRGRDEDGNEVLAESCEERFLGPLRNYTVGSARLDFVTRVGRPRAERPSLGMLMTVVGTAREGTGPVFNAAAGPTLHPQGKPSHVLGAFLLEARDLTNALGSSPGWSDKLSVRLYAGLPFP